MDFTDDMTLGEARDALRGLVEAGHKCPCCKQLAKVYRRKINSGMAVSLITMYRAAGLEWQHVPTTVGGKSREEGKLRYWGLVEEETEVKRDDGGRTGYWRVTLKGEEFALGARLVRKYARIYDGRLLTMDEASPAVSIRDALGTKFNYEELMAGV